MKKVLALALAAVMVMALCGIALADVTISVPSTDNHTYEVYQIFTATLDGDTLTNVLWGANGTGTQGAAVDQTTLDTIKALKTDTSKTESQKAALLAAYANFSSTPVVQTLTNSDPVTVAPGYYLIKDKDGVALADGEEHSLYIVQVLKDFEITRKAGTTTSEKTTDDVNDSDSSLNQVGQNSSDYDIGDDVPYHLKATITEKVAQYTAKYELTFEDTLEKGKFDDISALTIKVDGTDISSAADVTAFNSDDSKAFTIAVAEVLSPAIRSTDASAIDGFKIKITFTPKTGNTLEDLAGKDVTIDFTAKLGTGATVGEPGNSNTFVLKFSNNPNSDSEGESTEKKVYTFTYKIIVNKVDGDNNPLADAGFTLYKVTKEKAEAGATGSNAIEKNAYWANSSNHIADLGSPTAATPTGGTVANQFTFSGLDDGYYVLCETTTPTGYNTINPQVFVVAATHDGNDIQTLTGTKLSGTDYTITFTPDTGAGSLTADIQNLGGVELPSTGGIGTTIFYVAGLIMVLGAATILIARRKADAE